MTDDIYRVCCFTGHRPEKCRGTETEIRAKLKEEIQKALNDGYRTFITGMAAGVDMWAAEEVLKLKEESQTQEALKSKGESQTQEALKPNEALNRKEENNDIQLVCAVPFKGVEKNRTKEEQKNFNIILEKANHVEYISQKHTRWCFYARNEWMVDHAKRVIAVFNGTHGGTEHTINYAKKKEREIVIINDV